MPATAFEALRQSWFPSTRQRHADSAARTCCHKPAELGDHHEQLGGSGCSPSTAGIDAVPELFCRQQPAKDLKD